MKRIAALFLCLTLLLAPALAEPRHLKTILDFQKELNLSEAQIGQIKAAMGDLNKYVKGAQGKLQTLESEYKVLLAGNPTLEQARAKLNEIANAQTEVRLYDFQVSRRITTALGAEQLKRWKEIQASFKAKASS